MSKETRARRAVRLSLAIGLHPCAHEHTFRLACPGDAGGCELDVMKGELSSLRLTTQEKEFTLAKVMSKLQARWKSNLKREELPEDAE